MTFIAVEDMLESKRGDEVYRNRPLRHGLMTSTHFVGGSFLFYGVFVTGSYGKGNRNMNVRYGYAALSFLATTALLAISYLFIDKPVAFFCETLDQRIIDIFQWITLLGESTGYLIAFLGMFLFFTYYKHAPENAHRSLFLFAAVALSGIVSVIVKIILARLRPRMLFESNLYGFDFFRIGHEYNSFPSGHVTTVCAVATACSLFFPRYRFLFVWYALMVSISRVIINTHYVGDVFAGAYIGVTTVFVLAWLYRYHEMKDRRATHGLWG